MRILIFLFTVLIITSCSSFDTTLLEGSWTSIRWTDETNDVDFTYVMKGKFDKDDRYIIDINGGKEVGKYWIYGEYLHTVEDGQNEKSVKIEKLTTDTLILKMNRSGQIEKVVLTKD